MTNESSSEHIPHPSVPEAELVTQDVTNVVVPPETPVGASELNAFNLANEDQPGIYSRIKELARTMRQEHKEHKQNRFEKWIERGMWSTQFADKFVRLGAIATADAAIYTLEHTTNSFYTAAAAAGVFAVWNIGIGEVSAQSMDTFPASKERFRSNFPWLFGKMQQTLKADQYLPKSGLENPPATEKEQPTSANLVLRGFRRANTARARGFMAAGLGSLPFVLGSSLRESDKQETRKLSAVTSLEGSAVIFSLVWPAAQGVIYAAENGHFELAQEIKDWASDPRVWWGLAVVQGGINLIRSTIESTEFMKRRAVEKAQHRAGAIETTAREVL